MCFSPPTGIVPQAEELTTSFFRLEKVLREAGKSLPTRVKYFTDFIKFLRFIATETPQSARIRERTLLSLIKRLEAQLKGMNRDMAIHQIGVLTCFYFQIW